MEISIIIPTLQAEGCLPALLARLAAQNIAFKEVIIVDSSSTDRTMDIALQHNCNIIDLPRNEFRHGKARNLGARQAQGDILVFLTQDAIPVNEHFLKEITKPIAEGQAQAATARQLPHSSAFPTEKLARDFNYPPQSHVRTLAALPQMGIKTFFFSNSASAINHEVFQSLGGFSEEIIVNEDMDFCIRLLESGSAVAYQAQAQVYHSHNYSLGALFKRYFDIGVYFTQAPPILRQAPPDREGKQFVIKSVKALAERKAWPWIVRMLTETAIKYSAFQLGMQHRRIPKQFKSLISGQAYYWKQTR